MKRDDPTILKFPLGGRRHTAKSSATLGRGVWVAQWTGEHGEAILVAVREDGRRVAERLAMADDDHIGIADDLWALLDETDPAA